jgi:hypothetical protein
MCAPPRSTRRAASRARGCSTSRSGQAIALMEQAGFTNLTDLGSLEQAALATGLPFAG